MSGLFDHEFLETIRRLSLNTRMSLDAGNVGVRKSKSKGSSVEFSDFREYTEGDDFRKIDWNAYGRFERLFVKLFMEEREAQVSVFLDISKSMKHGNPEKSTTASRLAGAFAYMSLANYDRVNLFCVNNRITTSIKSLRGVNSFSQIVSTIENLSYDGESSIVTALKDYRTTTNKGISIIISDFLSTDSVDDLIKLLKYNRQDIYICHVMSPQELEPELEGELRLIDSETGEFLDILTSNAVYDVYQKNLERFLAELKETCLKWGAGYSFVRSDEDIVRVLQRVACHGSH